MESSSFLWILVIIILILVIIIYFVYFLRGTENIVSIQYGPGATNVETMTTGKETLFVHRSNLDSVLTIEPNSGNVEGLQIYIKNASGTNVTIDTSRLEGFVGGALSVVTILAPGEYATFIFTDLNFLMLLGIS